jgi:hypothetical protein
MSLFANVRAKWHPGSYLWIVPGVVTILASTIYCPQSENYIVRTFVVFIIVHCLNFIVWVHSRSSRSIMLSASINAVLMTFANQIQVVITMTALILLTLSYLLKSKVLSVGITVVFAALCVLTWGTSYRYVIPLLLAFLVMEYILPRYRNRVGNSLISMYFLVPGTFLLIFGILCRDVSVAEASLLLLPTFMAIR